MQLILNFFQQFHSESLFGGGGKSLDLINRPNRPENQMTPNRSKVFKRFNYSFKKSA